MLMSGCTMQQFWPRRGELVLVLVLVMVLVRAPHHYRLCRSVEAR